VHDNVVTVMRELDVDLSARTPRLLTTDLAQWADVVVTMGCGDECPFIPGRRYIDWELQDPSGLPIDNVRAIRDDISSRITGLIDLLDRKTF
jgi:protein-tyrosine-phosphatase